MKNNRAVITILAAAFLLSGISDAAAAQAGHHNEISLKTGLVKLWKDTGVYRFFHPKSAQERKDEFIAAGVKTFYATTYVGNFEKAEKTLLQLDKAGYDPGKLQEMRAEYAVALTKGDAFHNKALLPEGAGQFVMIFVGLLLIYLAISKGFEPLLLLPIGFGAILTNIPIAGIAEGPIPGQPGGFLYYFYQIGIESGVFPVLIFLGIGAMTDFGPLIANPKTALLGGAAQLGIFFALLGALVLTKFTGGLIDFNLQDAASIGIIGGADGPTAIFLTSRLSPNLLGAIAVSAYSYMALVPIIQPPIMKLFTTKKERMIRMKQLRHVGKLEKIIFPIVVFLLCGFLLPSAAPLIGMLMLGNLMRESMVVDRLSDTAQNSLINIVTIFLGLAVGSKLAADKFLNIETLGVLGLGLFAFAVATAGGVVFAKIMNLFSAEKVNPLIGSAGVSAVPMSARVSNKVGLEDDPQNFLLMHAMGPNVSGVIGSAVAAGVLLALLG
jgi:oxaloacetate decarboxylase beta subunit